MTEENTLYCYVHPNRETSLRCKNCERPICASCAVRTPTGYVCKECVRNHQKKFDNAAWYDYVIGFVGAASLSLIAAYIVTWISGFFFGLIVLFIAPTAGSIIARILLAIMRRRRSQALFITIAAGVIAGAIPAIVTQLISLRLYFVYFGSGSISLWAFLPLVWIIVYLVIAVPVVYTQFSGIRLTK